MSKTYETGYAHALNKRVILLTQSADDIPFDLKQYLHIVYDGKISVLKPELEKRVRWYIENPDKATPPKTDDLELFINGRPLDEDPEFDLLESRNFDLSLHNKGLRTINSDSFDLAIVANGTCRIIFSGNIRSMSQYGEEKVWVFQKAESLLPFSWHGYGFQIESLVHDHEHIQVQLYTELGMRISFFTVSQK